jgi:hypothetical protein
MPSAGNHENELGNGPIGYQAYQAFSVPESLGQTDVTRGLWYAFTAGSVRVISIANDVLGRYVRGAQKAWLEKELAEARRDRDVHWIVVCIERKRDRRDIESSSLPCSCARARLDFADAGQVNLHFGKRTKSACNGSLNDVRERALVSQLDFRGHVGSSIAHSSG